MFIKRILKYINVMCVNNILGKLFHIVIIMFVKCASLAYIYNNFILVFVN